MIFIYKFFLILLLFTISHCVSITVPPYSLSKQNIIDAKKIKTKYPNLKIKLGEFRETSAIKVYCNGASDIKANPDYATYIKEGIKDELEVAEIYEEGANIVLSGKVSFLPNKILTGKRKFVVDVTLNNKINYSVESDFNPTWIILNGCPSDSEKLLPTIQTLIGEILNHPELQRFIEDTK